MSNYEKESLFTKIGGTCIACVLLMYLHVL